MVHEIDCLICAGPCEALGVFHCGHFTCFTCALRIHHFGNKSCPVCRKTSDVLFVTRRTPNDEDGFDVELELLDFLLKLHEKPAGAVGAKGGGKGAKQKTSQPQPVDGESKDALPLTTSAEAPSAGGGGDAPSPIIRDNFLKCLIDDKVLASHVAKLYEQLCPFVGCWHGGVQEPFLQASMLKEHLAYDHKVRHCQTCLQSRPAFLCEQLVYSDKEMDQHLNGACKKDVASFQGHPSCRFCSGRRFYDVEHLVKHLQHDHFTCDLCNRGTFSFTFYQNRGKLIEHFQRCHRLCEHPDCATKDPMLRVFNTELDLQVHRQREHGAGSAGLSLEALGMFGAPSGASPATSANSAATRITFDFVSRVEVTDTTPKSGKGTGSAAISTTGGSSEDHHSTLVIPRHYLNPADRITPLMSSAKPMGTPSSTSTSMKDHHSASPLQTKPVQSGGWKNPSVNQGGGDKRQAKNEQTAKLAAANERFEELLKRYLANPRVFVDFRHAAGDYLSGKLLATEFYQSLTTTFFPQSAQLDEIFPLLIETMPLAQKAEALNQIRRMRNAPEIQRLQKAKEEDERKAAAAAALKDLSMPNSKHGGKGGRQDLQSTSSVVQQLLTKNQSRHAAWSNAVSSSPPPVPPPAPTAAAVSPTSTNNSLWNSLPQSSGGNNKVGSPTSGGGHADPENFPSLPGTGGNRRQLPPRSNAPRPQQNVWAQKAAKK